MTQTTTDAVARVKSLIELTQSLSEIFETENCLLQEKRPNEIAPLQAEKARLAAAYAQSIREVAANRSSVDGADTALLTELKSITKTFEERAANQRAILNGARQAAEGVARAVAEEASNSKTAARYHPNNEEVSTAPIRVDENA